MASIRLHSGQKEALREIRGLVASPNTNEHPVLIPLLGISGVGKDALWRAVSDEFGPDHFIPFPALSNHTPNGSHGGYRFTTLTEREFHGIQWQGGTAPVAVLGMDHRETQAYVMQRADHFGDLPLDDVVAHSLGVPLLVDRFSQLHNPTLDDLALVAAGHVYASIGESLARNIVSDPYFLEDYLALPMNEPTHTAFKAASNGSLSYGKLFSRALALRPGYLRRDGSRFRDPFFICPQSRVLYDTMFESQPRHTKIEIVALGLSAAAYNEIALELFPEGATPETIIGRRYMLFGGFSRKVCVALDDGSHMVVSPSYKKSTVTRIMRQHRGTDTQNESSRGFYFTAEDHEKMALNPLLTAMTTETLLQQLGATYIVDYGPCQRAFLYNPATTLLEERGRFSV